MRAWQLEWQCNEQSGACRQRFQWKLWLALFTVRMGVVFPLWPFSVPFIGHLKQRFRVNGRQNKLKLLHFILKPLLCLFNSLTLFLSGLQLYLSSIDCLKRRGWSIEVLLFMDTQLGSGLLAVPSCVGLQHNTECLSKSDAVIRVLI